MKKISTFFVFSFLFFIACTPHNPRENKNIIQDNFDFAAKQLAFALTQVDSVLATPQAAERMLVVPRSLDNNGNLRLVASRDWTSGFFPGNLWWMYEFTGDEKWRNEARRFTAKIEREKYNATTHDMGFKIFCSFGKGYRLTGDAHYRDVLLYAARTLITRYNPTVGAIRSWDHSVARHGNFPVIIDNMMNLELLFWAFRETGDSIFHNISVNHARTTIREHFRDDWGTYHVIGFNPETGEVTARNTHQGHANSTTWARGQAWAIYGFVLMYRETRMPEFLEVAKNAVNMFFTHPNLPEDLVPFWDFDAPGIPNEPRDVSAAAITASALYELSTYCVVNGAQYRKWADTLIENITNYYRAEVGTTFGFLLLHAVGHLPHGYEIDVPLVYADYYFLEALIRKQRLERGENLFR